MEQELKEKTAALNCLTRLLKAKIKVGKVILTDKEEVMVKGADDILKKYWNVTDCLRNNNVTQQ